MRLSNGSSFIFCITDDDVWLVGRRSSIFCCTACNELFKNVFVVLLDGCCCTLTAPFAIAVVTFVGPPWVGVWLLYTISSTALPFPEHKRTNGKKTIKHWKTVTIQKFLLSTFQKCKLLTIRQRMIDGCFRWFFSDSYYRWIVCNARRVLTTQIFVASVRIFL